MPRAPVSWQQLAVALGASLLILMPPRVARADDHATSQAGAGRPAFARARAMPVSGVGGLLRLKQEIGDESFRIALKLSRVDLAHAPHLDSLIVPVPGTELLDVAPFPASLPGTDTIPKLILVTLRVQAFSAYELGTLVTWGPICSGGRRSPTRAGLYHANWKDRDHVSTVDSTWVMPYTVNIDNQVGTALHEYSLPGLPVSHCCIRLLEEDARWIYEWVQTERAGHPGTPVVLFGAYAYDAPPPWTAYPVDPGAAVLQPEEIRSAVDLLLLRDPSWSTMGPPP